MINDTVTIYSGKPYAKSPSTHTTTKKTFRNISRNEKSFCSCRLAGVRSRPNLIGPKKEMACHQNETSPEPKCNPSIVKSSALRQACPPLCTLSPQKSRLSISPMRRSVDIDGMRCQEVIRSKRCKGRPEMLVFIRNARFSNPPHYYLSLNAYNTLAPLGTENHRVWREIW